MADWSERVEKLLYEGEDIEAQVAIGDAHVVVTTHRVLAFTPHLEGQNFRQVERPNVTDVAVRTDGEARFLLLGARAGLMGLVLLGIGFVVDFGALLGGLDFSATAGGTRIGIGGVLGMVKSMVSILANLDEYMRLVGALLVLVALLPAGVYLHSRQRRVVLSVAGEADLAVAAPPDDDSMVVEQLRETILPEGAAANNRSSDSWNPLEHVR